ncbi:hypothetical protein Godav_022343, partial [Gossypium davidsonii]|nr:hypothetical protein [Gossypium davidsonii]
MAGLDHAVKFLCCMKALDLEMPLIMTLLKDLLNLCGLMVTHAF